MKTLKRSLYLLLVAALAFSMVLSCVACGGEETPDPDNSGDTPAPEKATITSIEASIIVPELPIGSALENYKHLISVVGVYSDSTAEKPHKEAITDFTAEMSGTIAAGDHTIAVKSGSFSANVTYKGVEASSADLFKFDEATGTITGFVPFDAEKIEKTDENGRVYMDYPDPDYAEVIVIPSEIGGVAVTVIGDKAFSPAGPKTGFKKIILPDSITTIGDNAFSYASIVVLDEDAPDTGFERYKAVGGMDSIAIPATVTTLGEKTFLECGALINIALPESITAIGDRTFDACYSLKSFTVPKSVKTIGDYAFRKCYNLTEFSIAEGIDTIGRETFRYCESLESLVIPEGVTTIGEEAFIDCVKLSKISFPNSLVKVGKDAFNKTCSWRYNQPVGAVYAGNVLIGYNYETKIEKDDRTGLDKEVDIIPDSLTIEAKEGTTSIADSAFLGTEQITAVKLPATMSYIGQSAFDGCTGLTSVTLPANVSLAPLAFRNCTALTEINASTVAAVGENAFQNTALMNNATAGIVYVGSIAYAYIPGDGAVDITLLEGTTAFNANVFASQKDLVSIVIPGTVKEIPASAFSGCSALTTVTLQAGIETIGDNAFANCDKIKTVTFGAGLKSIGDNAFRGLIYMTEANLPDGLASIGDYAFAECLSITTVTVPASVTEIGEKAFDFLISLKNMTVSAGSYAEEYMKTNKIAYKVA